MKIQVALGHISGKCGFTYEGDNVAKALEFLDKYDHEGSSLSIKIETDDNEKVYQILRGFAGLGIE